MTSKKDEASWFLQTMSFIQDSSATICLMEKDTIIRRKESYMEYGIKDSWSKNSDKDEVDFQ